MAFLGHSSIGRCAIRSSSRCATDRHLEQFRPSWRDHRPWAPRRPQAQAADEGDRFVVPVPNAAAQALSAPATARPQA